MTCEQEQGKLMSIQIKICWGEQYYKSKQWTKHGKNKTSQNRTRYRKCVVLENSLGLTIKYYNFLLKIFIVCILNKIIKYKFF